MAGQVLSGSSEAGAAAGLSSARRSQMPARGQRSSPVSTNVRVRLIGCDTAGVIVLPRKNGTFMGFSFLRYPREMLIVYPGRV